MIYDYQQQTGTEIVEVRAALVRAAAHVAYPTIVASVYVTMSLVGEDRSLSISLADVDFPDVTIEGVPVVLWRELVADAREPAPLAHQELREQAKATPAQAPDVPAPLSSTVGVIFPSIARPSGGWGAIR